MNFYSPKRHRVNSLDSDPCSLRSPEGRGKKDDPLPSDFIVEPDELVIAVANLAGRNK